MKHDLLRCGGSITLVRSQFSTFTIRAQSTFLLYFEIRRIHHSHARARARAHTHTHVRTHTHTHTHTHTEKKMGEEIPRLLFTPQPDSMAPRFVVWCRIARASGGLAGSLIDMSEEAAQRSLQPARYNVATG